MGSLISLPEEIVLKIVRSTPWTESMGPGIRPSAEQLLPISQVNRQMRRICLPLLYSSIMIGLTEEALPPGGMYAASLNVLKRAIGDNPHLASLVKHITIRSEIPDNRYCVFDSLQCFRNLEYIEFPPNIRLDQTLLDQINAHPSDLAASWSDIECFLLPALPPPDLSCVFVSNGELSRDTYLGGKGALWHYLTTCDLGIAALMFSGYLYPCYFDFTYRELRNLDLHISLDQPEGLAWYTPFIDRHPDLEAINLDFEPLISLDWSQQWEIQKSLPLLRPLCDAVVDQRLALSCNLSYAIAERGDLPETIPAAQLPVVVVGLDVDPYATQGVIRCLGSSLPSLDSVQLIFSYKEYPAVDVHDFVAVCHDQFQRLHSLTLTHASDSLKLYDIACEGELSALAGSEDEKLTLRDEDYGEEMVRLARLLANGMPALLSVMFKEDESSIWRFVVKRPADGQGAIQFALDSP